ncbi:MAG: hypothetical protein P9L97_06225 [Candidatus Tenebribacter davisii]|nr:hypothetical protein [Candidatus Tenebribacter davisii]
MKTIMGILAIVGVFEFFILFGICLYAFIKGTERNNNHIKFDFCDDYDDGEATVFCPCGTDVQLMELALSGDIVCPKCKKIYFESKTKKVHLKGLIRKDDL